MSVQRLWLETGCHWRCLQLVQPVRLPLQAGLPLGGPCFALVASCSGERSKPASLTWGRSRGRQWSPLQIRSLSPGPHRHHKPLPLVELLRLPVWSGVTGWRCRGCPRTGTSLQGRCCSGPGRQFLLARPTTVVRCRAIPVLHQVMTTLSSAKQNARCPGRCLRRCSPLCLHQWIHCAEFAKRPHQLRTMSGRSHSSIALSRKRKAGRSAIQLCSPTSDRHREQKASRKRIGLCPTGLYRGASASLGSRQPPRC